MPLSVALVSSFVLSLAGGAPDHRPRAVDPDALAGCRAPDEPDCQTCCRETDGDGCHYLIGEEDWSLYDVDPWYNGVLFVDGACPADCQRCASCSERDEHLLESLAPRPDCDCDGLSIGIDPCYHPGGCACYCSTLESLTSSCPPEPLG